MAGKLLSEKTNLKWKIVRNNFSNKEEHWASWKKEDTIIYVFQFICLSGGGHYVYYDFSGNILCSEQFGCPNCCLINGEPILKGYIQFRVIWGCRFCE